MFKINQKNKKSKLTSSPDYSHVKSNDSHYVIPRVIDGRVAGYAKVGSYDKGTKTFTKPVKRSKHFMRHANGYGLQMEVFSQLQKSGAEKIRIIETDTHDIFNSAMTDWVIHGKVADFGYGQQIFLSEKYMYKRSPFMSFEGLQGVQNVPNYQKQPDSQLIKT
jgi:hypothetical protein